MNRLFVLIISLLLTLSSCSEYQKMLKSTDRQAKLDYAMRMYAKKKYNRATGVFEELYQTSIGMPDAEKIHFYYAKSYYGARDYLLASYFFELFVYKYPNSPNLEEAAYMNAMCYYNDSPESPLDQSSTYSAIAQLQAFVDRYPQSPLVLECNKRIEELREKLENKSYKVAFQYYRMEYYQAATTAFKLLMKDFPDTKKRDKCSYYVIKSSYLLAVNSIKRKKKDRLKAVLENYDKFAPNVKDDKELNEIKGLRDKAQKLLDELKALEENKSSSSSKDGKKNN